MGKSRVCSWHGVRWLGPQICPESKYCHPIIDWAEAVRWTGLLYA